MLISNIKTPKGASVPNQFIVKDEKTNVSFFQSYDSNIVYIDENGKIFLDEKYYKFSATTIKYRNMFLGETTKQIDNKILSGEYKLINLNC